MNACILGLVDIFEKSLSCRPKLGANDDGIEINPGRGKL